MRESRTYGSVRGALSNGCPYRVCGAPFITLLGVAAETEADAVHLEQSRLNFLL